MLFLNAVAEVYHYSDPNGEQRFNEFQVLMQKFVPVTPMTMDGSMNEPISGRSNPTASQSQTDSKRT
jgi:hypothetical protein